MRPTRRAVLAGLAAIATIPARAATDTLDATSDARALPAIRTIVVARGGTILVERAFRTFALADPTNIKSASKSIISALVGIAIGKRLLTIDQPIAPILAADLPQNPDPRLATITVADLLSMQAGLTPTSGDNYGSWVATQNWVRAALAEPFVADPGTGWQYSTGSMHLLSAVLTKITGTPTWSLAAQWLGAVPGFAIADWARDPQGIYLGGNEMSMTPHSLLAFGDLYRRRGRAPDGAVVIPERWIDASWTPRSRSTRNGDAYGYGWFLRTIAEQPAAYAWGFGGQMCYVVPGYDLVVVMTSDQTADAAERGYLDQLHGLVAAIIGRLHPPPDGG